MNKPYQFSYQLTVFQLQQRFQRALGRRLLDTKVSFFLTRFSTMGKKRSKQGLLESKLEKIGGNHAFSEILRWNLEQKC